MGLISVPRGRAVPWYSTQSNEAPPAGWVVGAGQVLHAGEHDFPPAQCIGGSGSDYQVQDFRNRWVLGADISKAPGAAATWPSDASSAAPRAGAAGGSNGITLTLSNLPSHSHTGSLSSDGAHAHGVSVTGHSPHAHAPGSGSYFGLNTDDAPKARWAGASQYPVAPGDRMATTGGSGSHGHTVSPAADGGHTHPVDISPSGGLGSTLGGKALDQRPRYCAVVWIVKVRN